MRFAGCAIYFYQISKRLLSLVLDAAEFAWLWIEMLFKMRHNVIVVFQGACKYMWCNWNDDMMVFISI